MSRSLHTQKLELRAARRLARPFASRLVDALRLSGRGGEPPYSPISERPPPLRTQRPLPGLQHALTVRDIRHLFTLLGPTSLYGLRTIQQKCESAITPSGIVFGEYIVPGIILLYAVPVSPWRLPYLLDDHDLNSFTKCGCRCSVDVEREITTLAWSETGLRDYALYEVLAHEIGHHQLQHNTGKRRAKICRRSDHEKRADTQARRVVRRLRREPAGQ